MSISRNGSFPSRSISVVKVILACCWLRYSEKVVRDLRNGKEGSNHQHSVCRGGLKEEGQLFNHFCSWKDMNILAKRGTKGLPIATLSTFWYRRTQK